MRVNSFVVALTFLISLSGCSTYQTQFDCPVEKGLTCASLKRVDRMVSGGYIKDAEQNVDLAQYARENACDKGSCCSHQAQHSPAPNETAGNPQSPLRVYFPPQTVSLSKDH